jgi:hypothetical protein
MRKISDLTPNLGLHFLRTLKISLIVLMILVLESCDRFTEVSSSLDSPNLGGFLGVQSYSAKSDTSVTLHWIANSEASIYLIYRVENLIPIYQTSVADKNSDHYTVTELTPNSDYTFLIRMLNSKGAQDKNDSSVTLTTSSAPEAPSSITLTDPSYNPGFENRPSFQVGGVANGKIVKLFSDSSCLNEVASGSATATTINLRVANPLSGGTLSFYANATNSLNNTSPCSSASVDYTYNINRIDFTTLGSYITMSLSASGATVTWYWSDGTISSGLSTIVKNFGSLGFRDHHVTIEPMSALDSFGNNGDNVSMVTAVSRLGLYPNLHTLYFYQHDTLTDVDISGCTSINGLHLAGSGLSVTTYDNMLISLANQNIPYNNGWGGGSYFSPPVTRSSASDAARAILVGLGWP